MNTFNNNKAWLTKKEVCQWLGGIDSTTLNYFIEKDGFPKGFKSSTVAHRKWYLPTLEKWALENSNSPIEQESNHDL